MPATPNGSLLRDLGRAYDLMQEGKYAESLELTLRVQATATGARIRSGQLLWQLAALHDLLQQPAPALRFIQEAVEFDPLSLPTSRSVEIIANNARKVLKGLDSNDPTIPELYRLLLKVGEADGSSHLAWGRHLLRVGKPEEALGVLRALTLLEPYDSAEAWKLLAEVARRLDRADLVEEAETALEAGRANEPPGLSVPDVRPTVEA
jgi:tetratricopeptide (TPR) repeat protein